MIRRSASLASATCASSSGRQLGEHRDEQGGALRADRLQRRAPFLGQGKRDPPGIVRRARAVDQACFLEPVEVPRDRRRGDALPRSQLLDAVVRIRLDGCEEPGLRGGDAVEVRLAAQCTRELEQRRPELVRDIDRLQTRYLGQCLPKLTNGRAVRPSSANRGRRTASSSPSPSATGRWPTAAGRPCRRPPRPRGHVEDRLLLDAAVRL